MVGIGLVDVIERLETGDNVGAVAAVACVMDVVVVSDRFVAVGERLVVAVEALLLGDSVGFDVFTVDFVLLLARFAFIAATMRLIDGNNSAGDFSLFFGKIKPFLVSIDSMPPG